MKKSRKIKKIDSLNEVPNFKSEDEEWGFWQTHGLSEELMDELYDPAVEKEERELSKRIRLTDRRKKK